MGDVSRQEQKQQQNITESIFRLVEHIKTDFKIMSSISTPLPDPDGDNRWLDMHNRFCAEAREAEPDVLWVGDSLIQDLVNSHIWERHFCQMHSLNFGIGGNLTQHVLWRLQNGELEVLSPKVIVLQVGANNHGDSAEEIAEGIKTICNLINDKQPQAFLVVLTLLPRGYSPNSLRDRNSQVNTLVSDQLKGNSRAQLVNIDANFVQADGTISHHDMHDYLHLTQKGYDKAFEPVNDLLIQLLTESETDHVRTEAEGAAD